MQALLGGRVPQVPLVRLQKPEQHSASNPQAASPRAHEQTEGQNAGSHAMLAQPSETRGRQRRQELHPQQGSPG